MPQRFTPSFVVAAIALGLAPAAAQAKTLGLDVTAIRPAAASPSSSRIVVQTDPQHLTVQVPGKADRGVTTSDECTLLPLSSGPDGLCTGPRTVSAVDGHVTTLTVPQLSDQNQFFEHFDGIGSRWIAATMLIGDRSSPPDTPVLVDRRTGAVTDLSGVYTKAPKLTSRSYLDLSRAQPVRTLCSSVKRLGSLATVTTITSRAGWTLQNTGRSATLQRCGASKRTKVPGNAVLGSGYAAWETGSTVTLRNLRSGRDRSFALGGLPVDLSLAFSSNRLLVSVRTDESTTPQHWRIGRIPITPHH